MRKNQEWFPLKLFPPPPPQKEASEEARLTKRRLMMEEEERPAVTLCVSADHDSILKPRERGAVTRIAAHPLHTHPCLPPFLPQPRPLCQSVAAGRGAVTRVCAHTHFLFSVLSPYFLSQSLSWVGAPLPPPSLLSFSR